ncbi:helix-turn-helix domain-containing protein [Clostridium tyrobutyricum]|uniref:helix-turn-helix domain-containing protein n=1 Tax=Clostridium tyrobutyricum TaxID=1519 RepID=UPI00189FEB69|nr:helix-turn-helix transcriptional regulator [Clostridium tyrobutyricum]MBR9648696.1 helix-turn-helix transcriptional regulator [Clostridium tyrobutyricum]
MINIGKKLIHIRKINNISANKLAISIGVDPSTINKIEKGTAKPSIDLLIKICKFFSITLSEFFNDGTNSEPAILNPQLKELLHNAKDLTPEQLELLSKFIKSIK